MSHKKAKNLKKTDASFWGFGVFFGGGVVIAYFEILIKQERKKAEMKESQSPPKLPPKERQKEIEITFWRIAGFFWPFFYHIFCVQPPLNP